MYTAVIDKVSDLSAGGQYEVTFTVYNDDKSNSWQETVSLSQTEYPDVDSVKIYIRKRISFYKNANSLIANLKKEVGVEIKPNVTPGEVKP